MNTAQFFLKHLGKEDDDYGTEKDACVNLIKSYYAEVLGLTPFVGNAIDYLHETRLPLLKDKNFQAGDILIFNYGKVGHIGLCVWTRNQDFECLEQNNPFGSPCHYVYHTDFQNVVGYLRPKLQETPRPQPTIQPSSLTIARIGLNLPPFSGLQAQVAHLTNSKLSIACVDYNQPELATNLISSQDTQKAIDLAKPLETFIQIFFQTSGANANIAASAAVGSKYVTATPNTITPFALAYELANLLWDYCMDHGVPLGLQPDANELTPEFVQAKWTTILPHLSGVLK